MRPIDAEALMKRLKAWDTNDAMDKALYNFARDRVLEAPTIHPIATCDGCRHERLRNSFCEYCMRRFADHYEPAETEEKWDYA